MNRCKPTLLAVILASAGLASAAWAQNQTNNETNRDATQVVPGKEDLKPGARPSVQRMDDNVQRQHDRDTGSTQAGSAGAATAGGATQVAQGVRDWNKIDKNNDNLVQPEEMEAWLKQVGPQAKQ